jgi:hypothetical protein
MNPRRRNIIAILDNALRWTGIPARVADEMSDAPSVDRKHRPLRWIPFWPIAFSCALFILSLTKASALNLMALVPSLAAARTLPSGPPAEGAATCRRRGPTFNMSTRLFTVKRWRLC